MQVRQHDRLEKKKNATTDENSEKYKGATDMPFHKLIREMVSKKTGRVRD